MLAARDNNALLVSALLRHGADPDLQTADGKSALDVARKWKSHAVEAALGG